MTLIGAVRAAAAKAPHVVAYTFLTEGEVEAARVTYAELDRQARGIAAALQELGAAGERVLLLFPSGLEFIAAFLGCLYAGAVAVPAYPPRSARGLPRLRAILDDARPRMVLTTGELSGWARELLARIAGSEPIAWLATAGLEAWAEDWREPSIDGDTLAFLQYTSARPRPQGGDGQPRQPPAQQGDDPACLRAVASVRDRRLAAALPRHGADREHLAASLSGGALRADGAGRFPATAAALAGRGQPLSRHDQRRPQLRL